MKKWIIIIFLVLLNFSSLFTQDNTTDNTTDNWKKKSEEFKYKSITKDIVNADYNQLKSMAMALGLEEQNNSTSYREALARYYNIKLFEKEIKKKGEKIVLERAGELKSFKVVEENEENLHIIGKVKIGLYTSGEDNKEVVKSIEADEVFINTKTKEITGIGNVRFKDEKLEYEGVQFYYNYEINRGALFEGRTKLINGGDSGLDGAFFKGQKVYQTGKDDIILYNGLLTTCEEYNPHYYMSVSRLWLSEKGEWGIFNGVIHIGPIPFFYIPIYYHPKELLINPAFGFRSREGWYLNTTYYVFGKKEAETIEDTDSTSSTSSDTTSDVTITSAQLIEQRRKDPTNVFTLTSNKIYSMLDKFYNKHKFYTSYPMFKIYPELESIDISLNFFTDAYTNLGFYLGGFFYIDAKYSNFPFKFKVLSDFGFSRTLWKDEETGLYTYYNPEDKPTSGGDSTNNDYNKNTYYNLNANPLIFRLSQWAKFSGSLFKQYVTFDYDAQVEYVSDKSYFKDFYNRRLDFTYLDLLADTISYGVQSQGMSNAGIEKKGDKVVNPDYEEINTYLWTNFALKKYPDIFGLNIISNLSINAESKIKFLSPELKDFSTIRGEDYLFDTGDDPKKNRYFLYTFTAPELKEIKMKGTLLDYDAFLEMPDKVNVFRNNLKNKDKSNEGEGAFDKLYIYINNIKNADASTDKTKLDYKLLLPFFSKSIPLSMITLKDKDYKFNTVLFNNEYNIDDVDKKNEEKKIDEKNMIIYAEKYFSAVEEKAYEKIKYDFIKPIDFDLNYEASNKLTNTFYFDSSSNIYKEYDYEFDTTQLLLRDSSIKEKEKILDQISQRLNIINVTNFGLTGTLEFFKFSDSKDVKPILGFSPQFFVSSIEHFDNIDLYSKYLEAIDSTLQDIKDKQQSLIKDNFSKTELKLNYLDTIVNDFSFGLYRIRGTGIVTNLAIDLFTHNLLKERNFNILNDLNKSSLQFEEVDSILYSNRSLYDKITKFESKFTFNVNLLQEKNPHKLSMGIGPLIKWVIPSIEIDRMKTELWKEEEEDIISNSEILPEAKDYIYYRKNAPNLNDKINDFFLGGKFWYGPKFYRKMLDNVTYSINYGHTLGNLNTVSLVNDLIFKLDNIGIFSNAYGHVEPYASVYPDDKFKLTLLNSLITYELNLTFTKIIRDESSLTTEQKLYDEYKIITMEKKHTVNFTIPGTLFNAKLPHDNWMAFGSNTIFKWDRTIEWNDKSQYNYLYLYLQSFSLSLLMNIFKIDLGFKYYNFVNTGYGFELENGKIDIGYRVLEIPIFFRYFKLILEPRVTYDFTIKHHNFIEDGRKKSYNVDYYKNNKLSFNLFVDLVIGADTKYYTLFHFGVTSQNKKMYDYYNNKGVHRSHWGSSNGEPVKEYYLGAFFRDLTDSFNFSNTQARRESPFDLQKIEFWLEHSLCDWTLTFKYIGQPAVSNITGRYSWENTFEFFITWNLKSKNQLMKMLNKTKVNAIYNYYDPDTQNWSGDWKQPALLLDPDTE